MKTKIFLVLFAIVLLVTFTWSLFSASNIPASQKAIRVSNMNNSPIIEISDSWAILTPPWLEKKVFIHYAKSQWTCGNLICEAWENARKCPTDCSWTTDTNSCYWFLWKNVLWRIFPIDYVINPTNSFWLTEQFLSGAFDLSVQEWDLHTSKNLLWTKTIDYSATWDSQTPDWRNEIVFWDYSTTWVIAVTTVWWYFSWPPSVREIKEFDILFNNNFIWWDASINPTKMDFQNIVTHELWHGFWLDDLYTSSCTEETMYGYSTEGDISKRDLNTWDITGLQKLYWN